MSLLIPGKILIFINTVITRKMFCEKISGFTNFGAILINPVGVNNVFIANSCLDSIYLKLGVKLLIIEWNE